MPDSYFRKLKSSATGYESWEPFTVGVEEVSIASRDILRRDTEARYGWSSLHYHATGWRLQEPRNMIRTIVYYSYAVRFDGVLEELRLRPALELRGWTSVLDGR